MDSSAHPFLDPSLPIRWSALRPEHVEPDIRLAIERAGQALEAIAARAPDPAALSYESTFAALEEATRELATAWGLVGHLQTVCDNPALRQAHNKMLPEVSAFFARIPLDTRL